jgi:hypothetical protein
MLFWGLCAVQQLSGKSMCISATGLTVAFLFLCKGPVSAVALLLLLPVMLTGVLLNMRMACTSRISRQPNRWHKHLTGMPKSDKTAIVVIHIKGYSGEGWLIGLVAQSGSCLTVVALLC